MDSSRIEAFLTVAETLSFTTAAKRLHKNQSVLSRQISTLESETGILLFDRNTREVTLTSAGMFLKDKLKDLVLNYSAILEDALAIQSGYVGSVTICTPPGRFIGNALVPLILGFEKKHPEIKAMLYAKLYRDMRYMLANSQVDFLFAIFRDFTDGKNQHIEVSRIQNSLVIPSGHPLAQRDASTLSFLDFKDDTFIVLSDGEAASLKRNTEQLAKEFGFTPKIQISPDISTILYWVELGRGISPIYTANISRHSNPNLKFLQLPMMGYSTDSIIWNKENLSSCGAVFVDFVREYVKEFPIDTDT